MKINKIEGLIAATFAPYDEHGKINPLIVSSYASSLKANGVNGVFINGTTGEGASLSLEEKQVLMEAWVKEQNEGFKVIAMLGGSNQNESIKLGKQAAGLGLYGVAVTAPYYFRPGNVEQLVDYMQPIAAASPGLPFYFYHIPLLTKVELPIIGLLETVADKIPNFAGIKYTHHNLMEFNQCLRFKNRKYDVLWGWDETFLAGLAMGAKGAVGSTYNFASPLYLEIKQAFASGNMERALNLQEKSIDFIQLYGKFGGPAAGKAILKLCGIDCGNFRAPVDSLAPAKQEELKKKLLDMSFFDFSINNHRKSWKS
ncbi:dihydrodipicolinate synthase family protein [Cyclobacterium plantarum]|uniref:Dihydrodipicolinate synthetase n=1 Tax=Cyclobacterium plantarum TaxID=2716263 RepID=A0ABX0H7K9_9BACT|nr:dihydrodipicolinate synthase family protein [Cyclobacterium plantarum]NHE56206.1 dihydrodipicolinate synthetase [Cyclobacterium plantarum]